MLIWYVFIAIKCKRNRDFVYSSSKWKLSQKFNVLEDTVVNYLINKQRTIKWEFNSQNWQRYISMERNWIIILIYCKRDIQKDFIFKKLYRFIKDSEIDSFKSDLIKYNIENKCNAKGIIITTRYSTKSVKNHAEALWIELRDGRRYWKNLKKM